MRQSRRQTVGSAGGSHPGKKTARRRRVLGIEQLGKRSAGLPSAGLAEISRAAGFNSSTLWFEASTISNATDAISNNRRYRVSMWRNRR